MSANGWRLFFLIPSGTGLFLLGCLKAWNAPITWDEAYTFLNFVSTARFYPGSGGGMAANNHFLNTISVWIFSSVFGEKEFVLRLPNLLFYLMYIVLTISLTLQCRNALMALAVFTILNLNPYLVDFFCLSRGYGMAHALLLAAIWLVLRFYQTHNAVFIRCALICLTVMLSAGIWLVNITGAIYVSILFLPVLLRKSVPASEDYRIFRKDFEKDKAVPALYHLVIISCLMLGAVYLFLLKVNGAYLFGGTSGILKDMVLSISKNSLYGSTFRLLNLILVTGIGLLFFFSILTLFRGINQTTVSPAVFTNLVLFTSVMMTLTLSFLQFHLVKAPYQSERTALYLYVIIGSVISLTLSEIKQPGVIFKLFAVILSTAFVIHFALQYNKSSYHEWSKAADARAMAHDISHLGIANLKAVRIISSLELELPLKYYLETTARQETYRIERLNSENLSTANVLLLDRDDAEKHPLPAGFRLVKKYPQSGRLLINEKLF